MIHVSTLHSPGYDAAMISPFPGMDPYIEACGMREDFHSHLIEHISADLAERVPPKYVVRTGERNYVVLVNQEGGTERRRFKPDVGVYSAGGGSAAAVAEIEPASDEEDILTLRALVAEDFRETFVEIHALEPERRLVTCIEVLSPANKRKGTAGWDQYFRKRQAILLGEANLVEIDLLRGGERMPMVDALPASPYYWLVCRRNAAAHCKVRPVSYRRPIPAIPVPLEPPDADVPLDLQPMIAAIYARFRYARDIDYTKPLTPPLPAEDEAWLHETLQKR